MAIAHAISNTDKDYRCVTCGSSQVSVVRNTPDPRLKCSSCNFMFNGSDAEGAEKAHVIPEPSADTLTSAADPEQIDHTLNVVTPTAGVPVWNGHRDGLPPPVIPRTPTHVFLSKDRTRYQFASKRDLKRVTIKWSQGKAYDLYELTPRQAEVSLKIT